MDAGGWLDDGEDVLVGEQETSQGALWSRSGLNLEGGNGAQMVNSGRSGQWWCLMVVSLNGKLATGVATDNRGRESESEMVWGT